MFNKYDIETIKKRLESEVGKVITIRYNYKIRGKNKNKNLTGEYIIENVTQNMLVLRKVINKNIGLIESYTFIDILSGFIEIIDIK